MSSTKLVGGLEVPYDTPDHAAYLMIARYYHIPGWFKRTFGLKVKSGKELGLIPPNEAMIRAIELLFEPTEFKMNPWSEKIIRGFCGDADNFWQEMAVMGPAAASKSETMGLLLCLHFFTSQHNTVCRLVSTDIKGLKQRSWSSVTKYFSILKNKGASAVFSRQTLAVLNPDDDDEKIASAVQKAGIFAFALKSATLEEGISKVIGTHFPDGSVTLLADEAQQVNPHFYGGLSNLFIGTEDVRLISLGNPMSLTDALANRAEPAEGGWGSVTIDDEEWVSRRGALVIHLDGEKSPALEKPDEYPFLINQAGIDRVLMENHGRKESNGYLSMVRGWWSNADGVDLLIPASLINKFNATQPVTWHSKPDFVVGGLDPAIGGDDCVLQLADVGLFANGVYGIAFREPIVLPLSETSETPVQYQIAQLIIMQQRKTPFLLRHLACDESGLQRFSDIIEIDSNETGILRAQFGGRPEERPVSAQDDTPGTKKYGNFVTQIWSDTSQLIQFDQVRGMPLQAAKEFAMRCLLPRRPLRLESKIDLKKRLKRSPDNADACALAVYAAITVANLVPGASVNNFRGGMPQRNQRPVRSVDTQEPTFSSLTY